MDPEQTLKDMVQAALAGNWATFDELSRNYHEWRFSKKGFEPKVGGDYLFWLLGVIQSRTR